MIKIKFKLFISFVLFSCSYSFSANAKQSLAQALARANTYYEAGNCIRAIKLYEKILQLKSIQGNQRDLASYRVAYCAYNLGELDKAKSGFGDIIEKYPQEQEARLRYAETVFAMENYDEAIRQASLVSDPTHVPAAQLLIARAYIEIQEGERALETLKQVPTDKEQGWEPVVEYWRGMAYYQLLDEISAERAFIRSIRTSSKELWTKSAAKDWLKILQESKTFVHARLGATYGYDDNVGQSTYRDSSSSGPNESYYTGDSYFAYDVSIYTKPMRSGKSTWTPSLSSYIKTHNHQESYDLETFSADLAVAYPTSKRWTVRGSANFTNMQYNWDYYQDYLSLNSGVTYGISKNSSANASLGITRQINTAPGWSLGPTLGYQSEASWFYWLANLSATLATGEKATITGTGSSAAATKGVLFSNYISESARLGFGCAIPFGFDFLGQAVYTLTTYDKEDVPSSSAFSTAQRKDKTWTLQATVTQGFGKNWTFSANYSYTDVTSEGFQGILYSTGSSVDYNVTRSQISTSLAYGW